MRDKIDLFFEKLKNSESKKQYKAKKKKSGCLSLLAFLSFITFLGSFFIWLLFSFGSFLGFMGTITKYSFFLYFLLYVIRKWPIRKFKPNIHLQKELKQDILPLLTKQIYTDATFKSNKKVKDEYLKEADFLKLGFFDSKQ